MSGKNINLLIFLLFICFNVIFFMFKKTVLGEKCILFVLLLFATLHRELFFFSNSPSKAIFVFFSQYKTCFIIDLDRMLCGQSLLYAVSPTRNRILKINFAQLSLIWRNIIFGHIISQIKEIWIEMNLWSGLSGPSGKIWIC